MMVTYVRGHFKNVHGSLEFDTSNPGAASVEVTIDATGIWTGDADRDAHLRSPDFLDVEKFPQITFRSSLVDVLGENDYQVTGGLTIRGVTRPVTMAVEYLGHWQTPWWEDGVDKGPKTRAGFLAKTSINRQDFGVTWNNTLDSGGIVVGNTVEITIDAEAILDSAR
jgi:polyisoprenoid-binding protein YceI